MTPVDSATSPESGATGAARIHESGYRRYDGPRMGTAHAARVLVLFALQRVLGLRRPTRTKVVPFLLIGLAYVPAIVFVGLAALLPERLRNGVVPSYTGYYSFVSAVIVLLVAFCAPEAFGADRRSRALSLYLAAPLTRLTYLLAIGVAVAFALALITIGPLLLLVIGLTLQGAGPHGIAGFAVAILRIVAAGGAMAVFYSCVSAGVSSLTDRRAIGSAAIVLLVWVGDGLATGLVASGAPRPVRLVGIGNTMSEVVLRIFGRPTLTPGAPVDFQTPTLAAFAAALAWAGAGAGLAWWRYRRLQVTR